MTDKTKRNHLFCSNSIKFYFFAPLFHQMLSILCMYTVINTRLWNLHPYVVTACACAFDTLMVLTHKLFNFNSEVVFLSIELKSFFFLFSSSNLKSLETKIISLKIVYVVVEVVVILKCKMGWKRRAVWITHNFSKKDRTWNWYHFANSI